MTRTDPFGRPVPDYCRLCGLTRGCGLNNGRPTKLCPALAEPAGTGVAGNAARRHGTHTAPLTGGGGDA